MKLRCSIEKTIQERIGEHPEAVVGCWVEIRPGVGPARVAVEEKVIVFGRAVVLEDVIVRVVVPQPLMEQIVSIQGIGAAACAE